MNQAYASRYSKNLERFYILDLQDMSGTEAAKNKAAYTREGRRQLFALLQGARGSTGKFLFYADILLSTSVILVEMETLVTQERYCLKSGYLFHANLILFLGL